MIKLDSFQGHKDGSTYSNQLVLHTISTKEKRKITWSSQWMQKKHLIKLNIHSFFFNLFIYFWLCWVFVSVQGLSLVVASGGHSSSWCAGLSLSRPLLLWSTGSRHAGSVVVAHGLSCSAACGIFPDQGSNPCPLHWQADSQPLHHQGSPKHPFLIKTLTKVGIEEIGRASCRERV